MSKMTYFQQSAYQSVVVSHSSSWTY